MSQQQAEPKQIVSRFAIAGAVFFPFGFLLILLFFPVTALIVVLIALGGIALIISTTFGFLGIRQIREAGGTYYGMRLSVFLSLFYPIIILNLLLFMLGWSILGSIITSSLLPLVFLVVVVLVDYWIVRVTWNRAIL
jgi:isoprenylcysteine carboxyl methyltransferase (ICMT) family protein YpbQ